MIRLVTGPLGTGKSAYGVRKAADAFRAGKLVATNFDLREDWAQRIAGWHRLRKSSAKVERRAKEYEDRYIRIESFAELEQLRVRQTTPWAEEVGPDRWQVKEMQLTVILDEAHNWLNARSWSGEGRDRLLKYFALARKRGMVIYLIAHRPENLDVQVRELFEDRIALTNLKRSTRIFGIPIIPFNFFIARWRNHAYGDDIVAIERQRLGYERHLYNTMDTISFDEGQVDDDGPAIWLPRRAQSPDDAGDAAQAAAPAPPADVAPETQGGPVIAPGYQPPDPSL